MFDYLKIAKQVRANKKAVARIERKLDRKEQYLKSVEDILREAQERQAP